jgi:hypothetical protein
MSNPHEPEVFKWLHDCWKAKRKRPFSSYVTAEGFRSCYMRYGSRFIPSLSVVAQDVITIANVAVDVPNQGTFTKFVSKLQEEFPWHILLVESIQNSQLVQMLLKRKFEHADTDLFVKENCPNLYWQRKE